MVKGANIAVFLLLNKYDSLQFHVQIKKNNQHLLENFIWLLRAVKSFHIS